MRGWKRLLLITCIALAILVVLNLNLSTYGRVQQSKSSVDVISLILTAPDHHDERAAVRKTWVTLASLSAHRYFFFIAARDLDPSARQLLDDENRIHGDLVLLPDAAEKYDKLTIKVLRSFQWIWQQYPAAQYVFKGDDDTYVRMDRMLEELRDQQRREKPLYWGYFDGRAPVKRSGKWEEKAWFLCDRYLPYALGGGYVLSMSLVQYIATNADQFQQFKSEDVSVGLWLAALNITRKHDVRFDTEWKSRGCSNDHIVMHKQTPVDMYTKHKQLEATAGRSVCQIEETKRHAYEYRWELPASQCCPGRGSN